MRDQDCVALLQWCLPRLGLRWAGFRKVRRTVCKRISRRMRVLGLADSRAYRAFLIQHAEEWQRLDALCRIPISRFYRDREVFSVLEEVVLPELAQRSAARGDGVIRCWSAGCASGEEAYTLGILWQLSVQQDFPGVVIDICGTDVDEVVLRRAKRACYALGSLKGLPARYRGCAFIERDGLYCLRPELRSHVTFRQQDIRTEQPAGSFDLVLCRNSVFTYCQRPVQRAVLGRIGCRLSAGSFLVIGAHENLPADGERYAMPFGKLPIYRHSDPRGCDEIAKL